MGVLLKHRSCGAKQLGVWRTSWVILERKASTFALVLRDYAEVPFEKQPIFLFFYLKGHPDGHEGYVREHRVLGPWVILCKVLHPSALVWQKGGKRGP
jgi:hypothetical protein